eukprot:67670-Karenia_brevis.AAC.1
MAPSAEAVSDRIRASRRHGEPHLEHLRATVTRSKCIASRKPRVARLSGKWLGKRTGEAMAWSRNAEVEVNQLSQIARWCCSGVIGSTD